MSKRSDRRRRRPWARAGLYILAAVWAAANTRDAILAAFRRREVYATTGPRIVVRLAAGWDFETADKGDASLLAPGGAPRLLVQAMKDPVGAHLDRVQVVKGWLAADGTPIERVYDVAWSGERSRAADGRVPPVGNTVDPATARYTNDIGSPVLTTVWRDPDFDPARAAFYYVRVLEIPTPRHSTFDALALGLDPREAGPPWWIQERAYTSPVWYGP